MDGSNVIIKDFDLKKALGGASIGWVKGKDGDKVVVEASDFKEVKPGLYSYYAENKLYHCFKDGEGRGENTNVLYLLEMKMPETKGTVATRGDAAGGTEEVQIDVLQPRETFACYAMMGILSGMDDALRMDTCKMGLVVSKSFEMAQLMMQEAARQRAANPEETEPEEKEEIDVNPELITSTTDKLLYNLGVNLEKLAKQDKEHYDEVKTNGLKIAPKDATLKVAIDGTAKVSIDGTAKVDVASVSASSVPVSGSVSVSNSELDVNVTNGSIDVNVTNFPEESTGGEESTT